MSDSRTLKAAAVNIMMLRLDTLLMVPMCVGAITEGLAAATNEEEG